MGNLDAIRHPFRVQGESLGHRYDPGDLEGADLKAYDDAFIANVRQESAKRGLPEPAYFRHQEFPTSGFGVRTAANLYRAVAGTKQSELKLFRRGSAVTDPDVFVQGLAGNIKRRHQWNAVADTVDAHAYQWSRGHSGAGRSLLDIKREIQRRGLSFDDFEFVNFGRFRRAAETADPEIDTPSSVRGALKTAITDADEVVKGTDAELAEMRGFVAVPKGVGDELKSAITPSGKALRGWGKLQGIQSAVILGLNPSWLQMQVAANTFLFGIGAKGNVKDLIAGQKWYKDLPDDLKQQVDEQIGVGVGRGHASHPHMGSTGGSLVNFGRSVGQIPLIRSKRGTLRVTDLNPINPLFALDEVQNRTFRRAVLYNEAKRAAFRDMNRNLGQAATHAEKVAQILKLKPGEKLDAQLRRVLENPQQIEALGKKVDLLLGDYLRFTARERKFLKPFGMFYGFTRYAVKTLFYTLPVKHPIAAAIAGKLGQLHNEELYRLFGTRDIPPWVLSRMYEIEGGKFKRDSKGMPKYTDLARINPVTSPAIELVERGPKAVGLTASPLVQAVMDQFYARSLFTGRGWQVGGSAEENPSPNAGTRARIFTNQILSSAFPYREASKITQLGTQGSDTLLGSPRPLKYKTAGPQAQEAQRRANTPTTGEMLRSDLAPLFFPKRDVSTEAQIAKRGGTTAPSKPRSREEQLLLKEAEQAQQEAEMSERERQMLIREALAG